MYKNQCWPADVTSCVVINATCFHRGNTIRNHFVQNKSYHVFFLLNLFTMTWWYQQVSRDKRQFICWTFKQNVTLGLRTRATFCIRSNISYDALIPSQELYNMKFMNKYCLNQGENEQLCSHVVRRP